MNVNSVVFEQCYNLFIGTFIVVVYLCLFCLLLLVALGVAACFASAYLLLVVLDCFVLFDLLFA